MIAKVFHRRATSKSGTGSLVPKAHCYVLVANSGLILQKSYSSTKYRENEHFEYFISPFLEITDVVEEGPVVRAKLSGVELACLIDLMGTQVMTIGNSAY